MDQKPDQSDRVPQDRDTKETHSYPVPKVRRVGVGGPEESDPRVRGPVRSQPQKPR